MYKCLNHWRKTYYWHISLEKWHYCIAIFAPRPRSEWRQIFLVDSFLHERFYNTNRSLGKYRKANFVQN